MSFRKLLQLGSLLLLFALGVSLSSLLSSWLVARQLAAVLQPNVRRPPQPNRIADEPTVEIDFYGATGIKIGELRQFLREHAERDGGDGYPALLTLQNEYHDYLADSRVIVRWDTGEHRLLVGKSAIIKFSLDELQLAGLKIVAPASFRILRQRSIPLGNAFDPEERVDTSTLPFQVQYDGSIQTAIARGLARLRSSGDCIPADALQTQLRRHTCTVDMASPASTELTTEEIYRLRRDSVVIIAHQFPDGHNTQAAGFILDASGVIVTNYHVVDKPTAVSRGVLTSDGKMFPVKAVLAADRSGDVAILKIEADGLHSAALSESDAVGAPVTLISHPNSRYYSLTQGCIVRYWTATYYAVETLRMDITAESASGSSGAPMFNVQGNVAGIFSATEDMGYQMVHRSAIPSDTIRKLISGRPTDEPAIESSN